MDRSFIRGVRPNDVIADAHVLIGDRNVLYCSFPTLTIFAVPTLPTKARHNKGWAHRTTKTIHGAVPERKSWGTNVSTCGLLSFSLFCVILGDFEFENVNTAQPLSVANLASGVVDSLSAAS